jgi:hypothetical protein
MFVSGIFFPPSFALHSTRDANRSRHMPQHITDSIKNHNRINHRDVDSLGVPLSLAEREKFPASTALGSAGRKASRRVLCDDPPV